MCSKLFLFRKVLHNFAFTMLNRAKRKYRLRIGIAWVLLLTLMPFHVVKAFHFHEPCTSAACHHDCESDSNSSRPDSCPICHFTLSPFVQVSSLQLCFIAELLPYEVPVFENKGTFSFSYSRGMRAPPAVG